MFNLTCTYTCVHTYVSVVYGEICNYYFNSHFVQPFTDSLVHSFEYTLLHAALPHAVPDVNSFIEAVKKQAEQQTKPPKGEAVKQRWWPVLPTTCLLSDQCCAIPTYKHGWCRHCSNLCQCCSATQTVGAIMFHLFHLKLFMKQLLGVGKIVSTTWKD